jgi:hypothetical protein
MFGEILTILVGFFRWIFNKKKGDLNSAIYGKEDYDETYFVNYIIGLLIFFGTILLAIMIF